MVVTRETVAKKMAAYFHHEITLAELVDCAEMVMLEGEFDERQVDALRDVVSRLGLADVRAFGLTWEDCERFLKQLGYSARVKIVPS